MSCDSWDSNAPFDIVPFPPPDDPLNPVALYLGTDMEKYLTHPYASPLFGDFKGLPPMLIQGGDSEVLRDEITLLAHKATLAGVEVRHEMYEDCVGRFWLFVQAQLTRFHFVGSCFPIISIPRCCRESFQLMPRLCTERTTPRAVALATGDGRPSAGEIRARDR